MRRKGIAIQTVLATILGVISLIVLMYFLAKLVPGFGEIAEGALGGIKASLCEGLGFIGKILC